MFRRPPAKEVWEAKAAELVGGVLGIEFTQHDDGSQDGMVDFICQTPAGRIALEVTSTVDGHTLALTNDLRPPEGLADHLLYELEVYRALGRRTAQQAGILADPSSRIGGSGGGT